MLTFWDHSLQARGLYPVAGLPSGAGVPPAGASRPCLAALIVLVGLGLLHRQRREPEPYILLVAAAVFAFSLFFRSIDSAVCPELPLGTHFLWHLLNGVLLYLSMRAWIMSARAHGGVGWN